MRRLLPNGVAGIVTFALLALTAAGTAVAYFTTTGSGASTPTGISQIAKPTLAATAQAGGAVVLSWDAVTAPGPGTVTYSVSRNGGGADGGCSPTLIVTTCTDIGLEPGTYTYVVTAKWRSWTASSSAKAATVTVGPADHFVLGAASLTPTAGAADNLTITAKDAKGSTVTSYIDSHGLTFSGASASPNGTAPTVADSAGTPIAFGAATALTFSAGVATVSSSKNGAMKLYSSGKTNLEVSDGTISTETPLAVTVAPATAAKFSLAAATTTPTAGEADNLTITAIDVYGNLATAYTGSHNLTFSGAAVIGVNKPTVTNSSGSAIAFGTATALTFSAGVATVTSGKNGAMTLYKAESPSISVSESSITSLAPLAATVSPAAAAKFVLTAATATPAAGAADNLTITAQDAYGNTATTYTGSHNLIFSEAFASPDGTAPTVSNSAGTEVAFGSPTAIDFSAGVSSVTAGKNGAMELYKGGTTNLKASDGTLLTPTALVVTVGTTATRLLLAASTTTPTAGASVNLTITALDAYENTATSYTGTKNLTFSGASASPNSTKPTVTNSSSTTGVAFGTATAITFSAGVATVSSSKNGVMKLYDAEEASIVVSDGTISNGSGLSVNVTAAAASKLTLTAATPTPAAGAADNLTTTAQDTYGNVATSYTGAKSLTFAGAAASPNETKPTVSDSSGTDVAFGTATTITFSAGVATVSSGKNGAMKLYKGGSTSINVSDGVFTTANVTLTVATTASKFLLAAATTTPVAAAANILTITAKDPYENTVTAYTGAKNLTFSGAAASPSGALPTIANTSGTAVNFGTATSITFTAGVATATSTKNGTMKLNLAGPANITVSDGTISNATPLAVTVSVGTAARWGITNINISAGALGSNCLFTCTLTGLGNSGTVKARVAVTDSVGNTVNAVGTGHSAKVTVTTGSGTISGSPLAIPATGAAESATSFTFTSKSSGNFTETITAAAQEGTAYTTATLTATK